VGPVEFFDGPTMINTIGNTKDHVGTLLPDELLKPSSEGGLADDSGWPKTNDLRWWVAARVDLGEGQFSNPVRIAKEQADSIVQLARFPRPEEPIWEPLGGHIHLIDGIARSRQRVRRNGSQDHFWAEHDKTGHELLQLAATVGPHLPVVNPLLRRILGVVTTLNLSANSLEPDLLTHDVRALELISRQCEQPDWEGFLIQNNATAHAHDRALNEVYDTVSSVLHDPMLLIPDAAEFRAQIYYRDEKSQRMMLDRGAALALIAKLVNLVPDHNMNARKLRDVARRTQSVHDVGNWVSELMAEYRVKIARVARLRNGLTHGGAAEMEAARTVRHFISGEARLAASLALQAVVRGQPIKEAFAERRKINRAWRQTITSAETVHNAFFDPF
jgi:hypothetical protein